MSVIESKPTGVEDVDALIWIELSNEALSVARQEGCISNRQWYALLIEEVRSRKGDRGWTTKYDPNVNYGGVWCAVASRDTVENVAIALGSSGSARLYPELVREIILAITVEPNDALHTAVEWLDVILVQEILRSRREVR